MNQSLSSLRKVFMFLWPCPLSFFPVNPSVISQVLQGTLWFWQRLEVLLKFCSQTLDEINW